jgi:hypothetical protein
MAEGARPLPLERPRRRSRRTWILGAAALVALVAAAVAGAIAWRGTTDEGEPAQGAPAETSVPDLRRLADRLDHPVYWAGPPGTRTLEVTRTTGGNVFVRYLPAGTRVGDRRPLFTTVATYPQRQAYARALAAARRPGSARAAAPGGGLVVWNRRRPTSVYVAAPGTGVLVEVYDPSARRARALVLSGEVGPVG